MSSGDPWSLSRGPRDWPSAAPRLDEHVVEAMRAELPGMAVAVVSAIQHQVEEYADPFRGEMGRTIENAVGLALGGFLTLVSGDEQSREGTYEQVWNAAHGLGRGEARGGRSMDALLRAYRIGARVSWRDMSRAAVAAGLDAGTVAAFAELVFSYIDELSAASAAGHAEELTIAGRLHERLLEQVADALVQGRPAATVTALADRAGWPLPTAVTAVLVPEGAAHRARALLPQGTLQASGTGQRPAEDLPVVDTLLVPGAAPVRPVIRRSLRSDAVVGPTLAWDATPRSVERGLRLLRLHAEGRLADAAGARRGRHRAAAGDCSTPTTTCPRWSWARTSPRTATCGARSLPRSRDADRRQPTSWSRPCAPGRCTRGVARPWRPRCSSIPRPCATGWASCARPTATCSRTPTGCCGRPSRSGCRSTTRPTRS